MEGISQEKLFDELGKAIKGMGSTGTYIGAITIDAKNLTYVTTGL